LTERRLSRRRFLAGAGAAAASAGSGCLVPARAAPEDYEVGDAKPDHVSWTYDEERLKRYQALLDFSASPSMLGNVKFTFGMIAASPAYDTDAYVYWTQWAVQTGAPFLQVDGHNQDHEPYYVFVDSETGEVRQVVFSNYHWFRKEQSGDAAALSSERSEDATHVSLLVDPDYHHYYPGESGNGSFVDLANLKTHLEPWADNGFYRRLHAPAVEEPWVMLDREKWWEELKPTERVLFALYRSAGLFGGGRTAKEVREL
jgi:hypothetical protein